MRKTQRDLERDRNKMEREEKKLVSYCYKVFFKHYILLFFKIYFFFGGTSIFKVHVRV